MLHMINHPAALIVVSLDERALGGFDHQNGSSPLKMLLPIKTLQPTPSRFALGVARTSFRQLITSSLRSPVRGG